MAKLVKLKSILKSPRSLKKSVGKRAAMEAAGQLNLFSGVLVAKQRTIISDENPFAKALEYDAVDDPRAIEAYERAIKAEIRKEDALINVATVYAARKMHMEAIDRLSRALALVPDNAVAHYNLANVYLDMSNIALSRLHYEIALKLKPDMVDALFNLALVCLVTSDRAYAQELLLRYKQMVPDAVEIDDLLNSIIGA